MDILVCTLIHVEAGIVGQAVGLSANEAVCKLVNSYNTKEQASYTIEQLLDDREFELHIEMHNI